MWSLSKLAVTLKGLLIIDRSNLILTLNKYEEIFDLKLSFSIIFLTICFSLYYFYIDSNNIKKYNKSLNNLDLYGRIIFSIL